MKNSRILIFNLLLIFTFLFTACSTPPAPVTEARLSNATSQGNIVDDLEASLEEAVLTLSTNVSDMISAINNMPSPEGNANDKHRQYLDWAQSIESLDERIDQLEDTLDQNLRSRQISQDTYNKLYRELRSYEELLDSAEDKLETIFQVAD